MKRREFLAAVAAANAVTATAAASPLPPMTERVLETAEDWRPLWLRAANGILQHCGVKEPYYAGPGTAGETLYREIPPTDLSDLQHILDSLQPVPEASVSVLQLAGQHVLDVLKTIKLSPKITPSSVIVDGGSGVAYVAKRDAKHLATTMYAACLDASKLLDRTIDHDSCWVQRLCVNVQLQGDRIEVRAGFKLVIGMPAGPVGIKGHDGPVGVDGVTAS